MPEPVPEQEPAPERTQKPRRAQTLVRTITLILRKLGSWLMLTLLHCGEEAKKLIAALSVFCARAKEHGETEIPAQSAEEYILEPTRPEDYHGRGHMHAQKTAPSRQRFSVGKIGPAHTQMLNRLISTMLVCVVLVSAWQIGSILLRSIRTRRLNAQLSRERAVVMESAQRQDEEQDPSQPEDEAALPIALQETPAPTQIPEAEEEAQIMPQSTIVPDVVKTMKYRQVGGDALEEMAVLHAKNHDLVAWIQIPDVLDLPVVYRDNDYYLTRDFGKQKNASGTIFLDVNHPFKEKTQNLLLHGHNMKDGTMFGRLAQYLYDDTYLRNHPIIYFDTLWNKEQYVIFAVLDVSLKPSDPRFFNYFTHDTFSSDAEFSMYIRQLQLRSEYAIPIDVQPDDALLTLSTCLDDDRLVIVCRRLREGETRSELRTLIRMATRQ